MINCLHSDLTEDSAGTPVYGVQQVFKKKMEHLQIYVFGAWNPIAGINIQKLGTTLILSNMWKPLDNNNYFIDSEFFLLKETSN